MFLQRRFSCLLGLGFTQVRKIASEAVSAKISSQASDKSNSEETTSSQDSVKPKKVRRSKVKTLKSTFPKWLKTDEEIKKIKQISSFVYNYDEIAVVTMTSDHYITDISRTSFKQATLRNSFQYFHLVNPLLQQLPKSDLYIIENHKFPPTFDRINLHLRSITMHILGALQTSEGRSVIQFDRLQVGQIFDLIVEGTRTRKHDESVVYNILRTKSWKDETIRYSTDTIQTGYDRAYFQQYPLQDDQVSAVQIPITPATGDAILQAIAFWDVAKTFQ